MLWAVLWVIAQIIGGILYANLTEWIMHKYVLHYLGRDKKSRFAFHWHVHHRTARIKKYKDPEYEKWWWDKNTARPSEVFSLGALVLGQIWIVFFLPVFYIVCAFWAFLYYFMHKKSHLDPEWAKRWMPHHYDHHMGINQNANWCVTFPIWDYILGTRIKYDYDQKGRAINPARRPTTSKT